MIARLARIFTLATAALAAPAWAAPAMVDPATLDVSNSGDTAFMLICGALLMLFAYKVIGDLLRKHSRWADADPTGRVAIDIGNRKGQIH